MPNAQKQSILLAIQTEFVIRLQDKTTWGKNAIQALYMEVQRDILLQLALPK